MAVLIFDDDPACAELMAQVVRELGSPSEKFYEGGEALDVIRRRMPAAVVLDIMMPGMDGLTICRLLKSDERTRHIKVLVSSAKKFKEDKEEAARCGADAFIEKPYALARVKEALAPFVPRSPERGPERAAVGGPAAMTLSVWGGRAAGDPAHPTACATLDVAGHRIILDAGAGLHAALLAHGQFPKEVWLLLSHAHDDHVSGLGALAALGPEWAFKVVGPADTRLPLAQVLAKALGGRLPQAAIQSFDIAESRFQLWTEVWATALFVRHPGATVAYRIENRGRAVVYCPDNELEPAEGGATDFSEKFARFIRGADLLVHDARWLDSDYPARAGEGHGCPSLILERAALEGVRRLALFHMDARYGPAELEAMLAAARKRLESGFASLAADLAVPGASFTV